MTISKNIIHCNKSNKAQQYISNLLNQKISFSESLGFFWYKNRTRDNQITWTSTAPGLALCFLDFLFSSFCMCWFSIHWGDRWGRREDLTNLLDFGNLRETCKWLSLRTCIVQTWNLLRTLEKIWKKQRES